MFVGLFDDVQIFKDNNLVYINVKENPVIDLISIEGNKEISDDLILEELTIKSRNVYSIDVIKSDADTIETLYKRQGFFSTYVEPKVIKIDDFINILFYSSIKITSIMIMIDFILFVLDLLQKRKKRRKKTTTTTMKRVFLHL